VRWLSGERVGEELRRMLGADRPSTAIRLLDEMAALHVVLPEVTDQHGVPQAKIPGDDLFDHSMRTMDAAAGFAGSTSQRVTISWNCSSRCRPSRICSRVTRAGNRTAVLMRWSTIERAFGMSRNR